MLIAYSKTLTVFLRKVFFSDKLPKRIAIKRLQFGFFFFVLAIPTSGSFWRLCINVLLIGVEEVGFCTIGLAPNSCS